MNFDGRGVGRCTVDSKVDDMGIVSDCALMMALSAGEIGCRR